MIRPIWLLKFFVAIFVLSGNVSADIILDYDVADSDLGNLSPTNVNANARADDMAAGSGLTVKSQGPSWNWKDFNTNTNSYADAVAANDVWTWGFDVRTVSTIDLTTMDIRLRRSNLGPSDFEIQAAVNGGSSVSLLTHNFGGSTSITDFTAIDLSSLGTLKNGDSVVFTLGAWGGSNLNAAFDLEAFVGQSYGVRINGDVESVPEPTTLMLLVVLGIALIARKHYSRFLFSKGTATGK